MLDYKHAKAPKQCLHDTLYDDLYICRTGYISFVYGKLKLIL